MFGVFAALRFYFVTWLGERVVADMRTVIADPAFRARVESVGTVPRTGSPEEFAAAIEDQRARIAAIHQAKPAQ